MPPALAAPLQLVLDLFGWARSPDPAPAPEGVPVAAPPAQPDADRAPLPAPWAHPQANRQARLLEHTVAYHLARSRRRSIGFVVGPEGLSVRAPSWVALREVDAAVQEKAHWIVAKLQLMRERAQQEPATPVAWCHGTEVRFLGQPLRLWVVTPGQPLPTGSTDGQDLLPLHLPPEASEQQVREAAQAWFKQQARVHFEQRLQHYAPLLGVQWRRLSLSNARTRWGSAGSDGHIRLNWRLIHWPPRQIDYVVVHELAHLRVMDHSPRFWDTVAEVLPDWRERRRDLQRSEP